MKIEQSRINGHFWIKLNGVRYSYINIRKNACSAFRLFIRKTSPMQPANKVETFKFLQLHHKETAKADILSSNFRIVVLRDPVARLASTFKSKFIRKKGHRDIFHDFERVTGRNAEEVDFRTFVLEYIGSGRSTDPHLWTQREHLLEIEYNAAMMIGDVYAATIQLFGEELAKQYFHEKVNSSGGIVDICDTIDDECLNLIKDRYAADFDLIKRITHAPKRNGLCSLRVPVNKLT